MKLLIAGGVGEHGRSCFLVQGDAVCFLVDCGRLAGSTQPYPNLSAEQIRSLQYVFLTHSHADHTGALPWLLEKGFTGQVVASTETLAQLPFGLPHTLTLRDFRPPDGLALRWGAAVTAREASGMSSGWMGVHSCFPGITRRPRLSTVRIPSGGSSQTLA